MIFLVGNMGWHPFAAQMLYYLWFPSAEVNGDGYGLAAVSLVCCVVRNLVPVNSCVSNADNVVFCAKPYVLNMVFVIDGY